MADTSTTTLTDSYQLIVADSVTAYKIQNVTHETMELVWAASQPADSVKGFLFGYREGCDETWGTNNIWAKGTNEATVIVNS